MDEKSYQYDISAIKLDVDKKPESRVFHPAPEINISFRQEDLWRRNR
ncbi:hypothetical protein [Photorhabdus luminescens]|nr:hypothetical protein [Photorhabdus luminescens]